MKDSYIKYEGGHRYINLNEEYNTKVNRLVQV